MSEKERERERESEREKERSSGVAQNDFLLQFNNNIHMRLRITAIRR